jgi:metal-dependent amidase/aminoacylase/carboxypeptidase family protein
MGRYGIHVMTALATGTVGVKEGPLMAAPDKFSIKVDGKGGHGAMPHLSVDAMMTASQITVALQTVRSLRSYTRTAVLLRSCYLRGTC